MARSGDEEFVLTWNTVLGLIEQRNGRTNPCLLGLCMEEIEEAIAILKARRVANGSLDCIEQELLNSFTLKRYLLIKRLREAFKMKKDEDIETLLELYEEPITSPGTKH